METAINKIIKAQVKDSRCEVSYKEVFTEANYSNEIQKKSSQIVHKDLNEAFQKLVRHLVLLCEQPEANIFTTHDFYTLDHTIMQNYVITGFTCGGDDEHEGVTIIGQKLLRSGKVLNMIAPFTKFADIDTYEYAGELASDIEACKWEVNAYLFEGKWGLKQQEFDFDTPPEANMDAPIDQQENNASEVKRKPKRKLTAKAKAVLFDATA